MRFPYPNHLLLLISFTPYRYWLSVGAQPSDPVERILFRAGLLPPPPMVAMGRKGGPRDTRPVDPLTGRILTPNKRTAAEQPKDDVDDGDDEDGKKDSSSTP